jgi:hypothetical protein
VFVKHVGDVLYVAGEKPCDGVRVLAATQLEQLVVLTLRLNVVGEGKGERGCTGRSGVLGPYQSEEARGVRGCVEGGVKTPVQLASAGEKVVLAV